MKKKKKREKGRKKTFLFPETFYFGRKGGTYHHSTRDTRRFPRGCPFNNKAKAKWQFEASFFRHVSLRFAVPNSPFAWTFFHISPTASCPIWSRGIAITWEEGQTYVITNAPSRESWATTEMKQFNILRIPRQTSLRTTSLSLSLSIFYPVLDISRRSIFKSKR